MSHFSVLVIGEDYESQLAPFQENNMGDCPREYLKFCVYINRERRQFESEEAFRASGLAADEGEAGFWENPNRKWDWYQLGGRWTGFFKMKPGKVGERGSPGIMTGPASQGYADQARKGDIDFDAMRDEAGEDARARYRDIATAFGGEIPKLLHRWSDLLNNPEFSALTPDERRAVYWAQPAMKQLGDLRKKEGLPENTRSHIVWLNLEDYQCAEDEYVQRARNHAGCTFAVVKDGHWYEVGNMGWWGMVSNEKDADQWEAEFARLLDGIPDDTILSLVDCHI